MAGHVPAAYAVRECGEHVEIQRLARRAGFLGAIEHGDRLHRLWQRGEECLPGPRPVQRNLQYAELLAAGIEMSGGRVQHLAGRADRHDYAFGFGMAAVAK